jgi:hypothetical protein
MYDVTARTTRVLETGSTYDTFPTWSPRGDWIAFTSKRDGDYEIYRIKSDGTLLQRLTRLGGPDAHPSFSPDGEWIAFATGSRGFKDAAMGLVIEHRPVAEDTGKNHENDASYLELPGPLDGDARHHPHTLLWRAEANQALDEEPPAHDRQHHRYP